LRYKNREDLHRTPITFKIGDKMKPKFPKSCLPGQSLKFIPHFLGDYEVVEKMNDLTYKVKCMKNNKISKVHVNRMWKVNNSFIKEDDDISLFQSKSDCIEDFLFISSIIQQILASMVSTIFLTSYLSFKLCIDPNIPTWSELQSTLSLNNNTELYFFGDLLFEHF